VKTGKRISNSKVIFPYTTSTDSSIESIYNIEYILSYAILNYYQRGTRSFTRHTLEFDLPVSATDKRKYPDKAEQRRVILALRALGWSYREIAEEVGIQWTRVGQILKQIESMSSDRKERE
jgi:hypothetical protein